MVCNAKNGIVLDEKGAIGPCESIYVCIRNYKQLNN